ncbi:uncharacterized protein CLUP02_18242 [Colletotrichum lupini]|uniref:Uncharacterized protein n=1 Tax=Colletotrichum lupini TaxID=145971 RepID=A0A9Q8SHS5_9PEZI|nr:uncharacterized protein CLUP02_18242 [Colletotrichum lupini]UQC76727.1 hypothetical protein CLUP02_18242 [Colletotrichum lupini]
MCLSLLGLTIGVNVYMQFGTVQNTREDVHHPQDLLMGVGILFLNVKVLMHFLVDYVLVNRFDIPLRDAHLPKHDDPLS